MPKRRMKRHSVTQPLDPSYKLIPLTQGQNAIVDAEDFEWLNQWNWNAHWDPKRRSFYVSRKDGNTGPYITMHRLILKCISGEEADHKNRNPLDNRRKNLRKCLRSQNMCNRKKWGNQKFKGVNFHHGSWIARIQINKKPICIGRYKTSQEAAHAYDKAAKKYHGEFACLNFQNT